MVRDPGVSSTIGWPATAGQRRQGANCCSPAAHKKRQSLHSTLVVAESSSGDQFALAFGFRRAGLQAGRPLPSRCHPEDVYGRPVDEGPPEARSAEGVLLSAGHSERASRGGISHLLLGGHDLSRAVPLACLRALAPAAGLSCNAAVPVGAPPPHTATWSTKGQTSSFSNL